MRSSERPSGKIISRRELRASGYTRRTGDHYITAESRQLPELVKGVQGNHMARERVVKEAGLNPNKSFTSIDKQIAYNELIDEALRKAGWE